MENDNNRRAGPEHRQNHLRDKPVHDDLDLHVAHYRRPQEKYVYDATVGSSGPNISDQSVGEHPVHVDHVLRESRGNKWNSVARHWPRSCCDLHVLVVGSVQLFPVPEVRQLEQQDRPVRKTVQLSTTLKRIGKFHETKVPSSRRNWIVLSFFTWKGTISFDRTKERSNFFGERSINLKVN